jgi:superfamily II DNA/RNA helicase
MTSGSVAPEDDATADRLHPVLQHHIVNTLGCPRLRELQEAAIDPLLTGDDALLLAATASGKTEAAIFRCCRRWQQRTGGACRWSTCARSRSYSTTSFPG